MRRIPRPAWRTAVAAIAVAAALSTGPGATPAAAQGSFVGFETPQVHPLDLSPDRRTLAVVNTPAARLELYDVSAGSPLLLDSVAVGLDPVSVRFRSDAEAWVVNQVSDSVSVVDVAGARVTATLQTLDEPADVVFAGSPERAFVSCSQENAVLVFDPGRLGRAPDVVPIAAEEPRALAVSPDGSTVYAAIFESGNGSTVLAGGFDVGNQPFVPTLPRNVVSDPAGPWSGVNPPPNRGGDFEPPIAAALPEPPPVALIVKKDAQSRWLDDNGGDWTALVSGPLAERSGRVEGWDVVDRDVAAIDARSLSVSYLERLMNLVMAIAVHPTSGEVTAVGTDATNEVRFEPTLRGTFLRVQLAFAGAGGGDSEVVDLNPHLKYDRPRVGAGQRRKSLGDPRAIVWHADGSRAYVTGMGSSNVAVIDQRGRRVGGKPIEVGEGPTGLALDEDRGLLYVLNRFENSLSVVDVGRRRELERRELFDPTPEAIRRGRPLLYDTHATSGLGHVSCASCHVDARFDRLAWDLGVPDGSVKPTDGLNQGIVSDDDSFTAWHPMKGPMTTQTLQDIVGKEPHHWRGDRDGLEEFSGAFVDLLGDDRPPSAAEMQAFEEFLATLHLPPNPYRQLDNGLPRRLPLPGHFTSGRFGPPGRPLPDGNAVRGLEIFRERVHPLAQASTCVGCHSLPTGSGSPSRREGSSFVSIPPGPNGEAHLALIGSDASEQEGFKIPHLRNLYDKVGMVTTRQESLAGFGFLHDGSIDSLARFVSVELFALFDEQEVADLVALLLSFSGSGFATVAGEPPGSPSLDTHAAVGWQVTIARRNEAKPTLREMVRLAGSGAVDLVVKSRQGGAERGWVYDRGRDRFEADAEADPALTQKRLVREARRGSEMTFTVVPAGSGRRLGVDRDEDGLLDFDDPSEG